MHRNARSSITIPRGPTRGGSIDFALYQEPETLNPQLASQAASEEISVFIVEGLVGAVDDATYYPRLATEVPTVQNGGVSADGKTVIYHLKPGVRWSDGYPVSAEDVRFTWEAIMHPHSGAAIRSGFRDIETVECPDPATVVVRYKIPYAPYLRLFGSIMPKHVSGDPAEMPQWAYNRKPVGTGPFVLSDWTPGDRIMLVRNPWYRDANKPHLDAVTFRLVGDREVGKRLLRSAEVDVLWDLGESDIDELQHEAGIALSIHPAAEVERLVLNLADPAIDALIETIIAAEARPTLVVACRALDRVIRSGRYWIPHWYKASHWVAYWDVFGRPAAKPSYARGIPETWWYDRDRATKIERAG